MFKDLFSLKGRVALVTGGGSGIPNLALPQRQRNVRRDGSNSRIRTPKKPENNALSIGFRNAANS